MVLIGISIQSIEESFRGPIFVLNDENHSAHEERYISVNLIATRPLFVAFTLRRESKLTLVRVISARHMHKKEKEIYEGLKKSFEKEDQ